MVQQQKEIIFKNSNKLFKFYIYNLFTNKLKFTHFNNKKKYKNKIIIKKMKNKGWKKIKKK